MSGSALPYKRSAPSWSKTTSTEVRLLQDCCETAADACAGQWVASSATPSVILLLMTSSGTPAWTRCK